jgi:putative SOS response-associated peptidase YedK
MCGRVVQARPLEELAELYAAPADDIARATLRPRYNVAPTDPIAVVVEDPAGQRRLTAHRWGLIPPAPTQARDDTATRGSTTRKRDSTPLINARAETIATNALFRAAFRHRRCLVPVDGFYEWQATADGRQPYFIHAVGGAPLALAGIWLPWRSGPDGLVGSCSIVTSTPDEVVGRLHDRMPVSLPRSAWDRWLAVETPADEAFAILSGVPRSEPLDAYPVVRLVNSVRNDGPELLARAALQRTLF